VLYAVATIEKVISALSQDGEKQEKVYNYYFNNSLL